MRPPPAPRRPIDPARGRSYHYWHAFVPGVGPGQLYGYRVDGPATPGTGLRFDRDKVLLDHCGRVVVLPDGRSWNRGVEGPTDKCEVERLRNRHVKNGLTLTRMSLGVPMILMGDEIRRTQRGNNNACCHDDLSAWFGWSLLEKHTDVHRFVSLLAVRRSLRDVEHEHRRVSLNTFLREANRAWHGVKHHEPDWGDSSHSIALGAELRKEGMFLHLILNAYWAPLDFELPADGDGVPWRRWIDTALDSPDDVVPWQEAPAIGGGSYHFGARSVVMLISGTMVFRGVSRTRSSAIPRHVEERPPRRRHPRRPS